MADTGFLSPGSASNIAGAGPDWLNPTNVLSDNATYTTSSGSGFASDHLACTSFGASIVAGATINGIEVRLNDYTGTGAFNLDVVYLTKNGTSFVGDAISTTRAAGDQTYGGAANLWGTTWTRDEVISSNFGVLVQAGDDADPWSISLDYVSVRITYTEGPPPPPPTYRLSAQRRGR